MRRRFLTLLATVCLCLMTYGLAWPSAPIPVWLALSDSGGAHAEAAKALRDQMEVAQPGRIAWREAHWSQFTRSTPEPQWVVAIGAAAQRGMQELFAGDATPPPLLAILVPRLTFGRIADPRRLHAGSLSAVFLDQTPSRQVEMIRLALPSVRTVGVLVGGESRGHIAALERAAKEHGMKLAVATVEPDGLFAALQSVLTDADVLLALPDPTVFNSQTAASILTAAYRRQVPLVGFSPAWIKAGALLALYSTPAQIGARGADVLSQSLSGRSLPAPQWPRDLTVSVNPDVARSMGKVLDEAQLGKQLREGGRS